MSLIALSLLLAAPLTAPPAAVAQASDAGCVLQANVYTCNWAQFKSAFDAAHTVAIETQHIDRQASSQLHKLVRELGKTPADDDSAADLTMLLIPVDPTGVNLGPSDHDVATLRIYARSGANPRGTLLWAETYRGQGDHPWPSIVHSLVAQFQDRLKAR